MTNTLTISRELAEQLVSSDSNIRATATYVLRGIMSEHKLENWTDGLRGRLNDLLAAPFVESQDHQSSWEDTFGPDYEHDDLPGSVPKTDRLLSMRDGFCGCGRPLDRQPPAPVVVEPFELLRRVIACGALTFDSQPDFELLEADICACLDKTKELNQ